MNHTRVTHSKWPGVVAVGAALLMGTVGCSGDPFAFNWNDTPDTVLLFSLARPELNLVSAFGFFRRVSVRIEAASATGTWDAALDTRGTDLVLLPPGALGVASSARITALQGMSFEDVTRAPADTLVYSAVEPVPVRFGTVYVIRTDRATGSFGSSCVYYAKLEPVVIDVPGGSLTFRYVTNPICNSQDLVPPGR